MNKPDVEKNDLSLCAWKEWKKICAVADCSKLSRRILAREIFDAFRRKIVRTFPRHSSIILWQIPILEDDGETKTKMNANNEDSVAMFWANEFDVGIIQQPVPQWAIAETGGLLKDYKDFIWFKAERSEDPDLKVIRGKLTGQRGIINEIAEHYVRDNHWLFWENYREHANSKRKGSTTPQGDTWISLNEPQGGDGEKDVKTREDFLEDKKLHLDEDDDLELKLEQLFSVRDMVLILARTVSMTTSPETQALIGLGHTALSNLWNNDIWPRVKKHLNLILDPRSMTIMKTRLAVEKNAELFLKIWEQKWVEKKGRHYDEC